ncbi:hypothetical protein [Marinithermus hydrothermalis]|uniref:Uncharacterized protein n=1 Tax=Marinithermus hydrothermalis (strain DSM 14884 / JCM 11576 / T1) TaxID=869210 RepID=F2NMK0_MARHT|nr:hypothetical protein [Marinithermus hydrothermalis]AEB12170.1 hypothetical protein Marky_1435 [Marinithermus hydrothermalis DSM 14884]
MVGTRYAKRTGIAVLVAGLSLLLGGAWAETPPLARVEAGVPVAYWNPEDFSTYVIREARERFSGSDRAVLMILTWAFRAEDVGRYPLEMLTLAPSGEVGEEAFVFEVTPGMIGRPIRTYWFIKLSPALARAEAGEWEVYFLFNGVRVGQYRFTLGP